MRDWCPGCSTLLGSISACCKEIEVLLLSPLRHFAVLPPPSHTPLFRCAPSSGCLLLQRFDARASAGSKNKSHLTRAPETADV
jgi:hypothetical protein